MPGNRQVYDQAMNMGHGAAWDQQWDKAIVFYGRAVQEFPEDPAAHNSLGLALLQARRLEDALKVYTRAHQLAPDDPIPLEKSADVLERLGRLKEASRQYVNVAEIYLGQRDLEKAIGNWERATRLSSGLVQIHQRLALAYERTGQRKAAVREFLTLAFNFQSMGKTDIAIQAVERALRLEPTHPQAINTLQALKTGITLAREAMIDETAPAPSTPAPDFGTTAEPDPRAPGESHPSGPIGEAVEQALAALATYVFEEGMMQGGSTDAIQAIGLQRQYEAAKAAGQSERQAQSREDAITAYERALKANMRHPAIFVNLGALQLDGEQWKTAASNLGQAAGDSTFAAGAMHGMSIAYTKLNNSHGAAYHLIQTLRLVDVSLAMNNDEAGQLSAIYDQLLEQLDQADEQLLVSMNQRFLELLTGPSWKQRVTQTRRQWDESMKQQEPDSLISMVQNVNDRVTSGLGRINRYIKDGMYILAMDHAHFLLEKSPDYLPIHRLIGQILLERGNVQHAMDKYNLIANTYRMRSDNIHAAEILQEAIKIAPMDTGLRKSLIALLEEEGNEEAMLDQYIDMADSYYQLADTDAARSTFLAAIQLAQRINAPKEKVVMILHRLGDIEVSRFDLRQALRTYEQIRRLDPADERTRRALVDLNYRLNDPVNAVRELDSLLKLYAQQRKANKIVQVLEEQVTMYPNDMALRSRLAAVYRQVGEIGKSVAQLDSLAELQLTSGLHPDALVTIKRIIAMNPDHVDDYKRLYQQLTGNMPTSGD